jgi:hypothetical protein
MTLREDGSASLGESDIAAIDRVVQAAERRPNERHSVEPNIAAEVFVPYSTPSRFQKLALVRLSPNDSRHRGLVVGPIRLHGGSYHRRPAPRCVAFGPLPTG